MSKRLIAAKTDGLKKDQKPHMLKAKSSEGQQFNCLMEVGHIIYVDNIKYTVTHANKI